MAWDRAYRRGSRRRLALELLDGAVRPESVPVVMCLWNRPDRIGEILAQLDAQQSDTPVRLILWNNKADDDAFYRRAISDFTSSGALASVEYHCSRQNLGGIARFFVARQLVREGRTGPFIMLDDDQNITRRFVDDLLTSYAPRSYAGWWAFMNHGSYVERTAVPAGEPASYVGTGGSICDPLITVSPGFFEDLPRRYAFIEDLWASARALDLGWRVTKVDTHITFVLEELNQFNDLLQLKVDFYDELARTRPVLRHDGTHGSRSA
jgi:hypothetical protein